MGSPAVAMAPRKSPSSGRRTNKPLVEKKRRARINGCLGQLKSLILSAMQTEQGAQVSRLEKADILEMTVKYLRHVQRQQVSTAVAQGSEPEVAAKFSAGYTECATEVIRYIDQAKCVTSDIRSRLESHLVERLRDAVCPPPPASSSASSVSTISGSACNGGVLVSGEGNVLANQQQQQQQQQQRQQQDLEIAVEKETTNIVCSQSTPSHNSSVNQNALMLTANLEQMKVRNSSISSIPALTADVSKIPLANSPVSTETESGPSVSSASTSDEYARHYQTAVDLANMAAGVILPAQTPHTNGRTPSTSSLPLQASASSVLSKPRLNQDPARCKSISPAQENKERGKPRKRYNSTESALPQPQPLSNSNKFINLHNNNKIDNNNNIGSTNSAFTNTNSMNVSERLQQGAVNSQRQSSKSVYEKNSYHDNECYLRSLQRPLHIDIPECTDSVLNNDAEQKHFRSSNNCYRNIPVSGSSPNYSISMQVPPSSPSSASLSSSSSATTTIYSYAEDAPPTLLYAYNYNLPQRPNNSNRKASNSPRMNYSLVVCQPEGESATTTTTELALSTHVDKFHATFNLEQRHGLNGHKIFYCAPDSAASHAQGQGERTMQHPTSMNASSTLYPTPTSNPQAQEFHLEDRRLDVNNKGSFYGPHGPHQLHCPTFPVSQSGGGRLLRKDAAACPQIPAGFYSHTNMPNPDNSITLSNLAPAALSSNHAGAQFHGNSRTCTSTHLAAAPRWCNQSPAVSRSSNTSTTQGVYCVNSHNNGVSQQHAALYSHSGQSGQSKSASPPPPYPHSSDSQSHGCRNNVIHRSGVPPSSSSHSFFSPTPSPSPPHDTSRPALKKRLLFGQRSEVTRRQGCNNSAPAADETIQPQAPETHGQQTTCSVSSLGRRHPSNYQHSYSYHQIQEQTRERTRGEQYGPAAPENGAHAIPMSAKKRCLQPAILTSCYRSGHMTEEPLVWRPW